MVVENDDLMGADLRNLLLPGARFIGRDLVGAPFDGADLTGAGLVDCVFGGANPEDASTLAGTTLQVTGLIPEQRAACETKGAVIAPRRTRRERSANGTHAGQEQLGVVGALTVFVALG